MEYLQRSRGVMRLGMFSFILSSDTFGSMPSSLVSPNSSSLHLLLSGTSAATVTMEEADLYLKVSTGYLDTILDQLPLELS